MPLAWGIFLPFCARAARRRAGLCGKENLYTNSIIITIGIFCPCGRQCTGPCLMPGGLWAAAAGRLGAAPAAGSGKGGQKWQRRVVPLAVNSAGHWGSTGGRGMHWRKETAPAAGGATGRERRRPLGHHPWGKRRQRRETKPVAPGWRICAISGILAAEHMRQGAQGKAALCAGTPRGAGRALGAGGAAAGLLAAMHLAARRRAHGKGGEAQ